MRFARVGCFWTGFMVLFVCAAFGQTVHIQLEARNAKVLVSPDTPFQDLTATTILSIQCGTGVDCAKVQVKGKEGAATLQSDQERGANAAELAKPTRTYSLKDAGASVQLVYEGVELASALVAAGSAATTLRPITCAPTSQQIGTTYDRTTNTATFWVSHLGNIWAHPSDQIDENDQVVVVVRAPEDLLTRLRIKRTSATRVVGGINIIGDQLFKQALDTRAVRCGELRVVLSDFAAGTGQVQITLQVDDKEVPTGAFEFPVAALYDGYLSYASVYTDATARTFKLAPSAAGTVIVPGEATGHDDREIRYAVFYTHFVWGRREVVKGPERWYHRLNPTFGVTTSELAEHFLYGISLDLTGFTIGAGPSQREADPPPSALRSAGGLSVRGQSGGDTNGKRLDQQGLFRSRRRSAGCGGGNQGSGRSRQTRRVVVRAAPSRRTPRTRLRGSLTRGGIAEDRRHHPGRRITGEWSRSGRHPDHAADGDAVSTPSSLLMYPRC